MRTPDRSQYPFRPKRRAREGSREPVRKVARTRTPSAAELHPPPGLRRARAARFTPSAASPQTESRQAAALPRLAATPNPRVRRAKKEMRQRAAGEENRSSESDNESEGSGEWKGNTDAASGQDGSYASRQGLVWRLAAPESQLERRQLISIQSFDGNCKCPFYSECGKIGRFFELVTHFSKQSRLSNHRRWALQESLSGGQTRLVLTTHGCPVPPLDATFTEPLVRESEVQTVYSFDEHAVVALTHEHKRIELDLPSERWIKCPFCYRKYPNLCQLRSHINGSRGRHSDFEVEPLISTDEGLKRLRLDVRPSLLLEKHGPDPALGLALKECQDPGKKRLHRLTFGTTTAKENSALLAAWRTSCGRMPRLWKNLNQTFSLSALHSRLLEAAKSPGVLRDAKSTEDGLCTNFKNKAKLQQSLETLILDAEADKPGNRSLEMPITKTSDIEPVRPRSDLVRQSPCNESCFVTMKWHVTDLHIDCGLETFSQVGTECAKLFILYPPTPHNLGLFDSQAGQMSKLKSLCGRLQGGVYGYISGDSANAIEIPAGCIHFVLTLRAGIIMTTSFVTSTTIGPGLRFWDLCQNTINAQSGLEQVGSLLYSMLPALREAIAVGDNVSVERSLESTARSLQMQCRKYPDFAEGLKDARADLKQREERGIGQWSSAIQIVERILNEGTVPAT
ncbi:hypothetical protein KC343_g3386 [Hortaea werneckii]|nr:hypothetical protein KC352_g9218 [Hortaea werneckii]KAI7291540.1 hypothetical protein KC340_g17043 [Hortaea werneckii]KAI7345337.1 hypothetical protein KC320_g8376 [Hortaea werneckii]KAI7376278.1 hypothetical protein KC328_g14977 [Hortaea werneckii]KAI7567415.1 hypothetical protein KC317_g4995 [Hortaea werneckii]